MAGAAIADPLPATHPGVAPSAPARAAVAADYCGFWTAGLYA
ncbi:hypothetical protein [Streptoalloteichus tenebrarius]|nr:hypothetical protein [Streptoalloteichus tenebrarius]